MFFVSRIKVVCFVLRSRDICESVEGVGRGSLLSLQISNASRVQFYRWVAFVKICVERQLGLQWRITAIIYCLRCCLLRSKNIFLRALFLEEWTDTFLLQKGGPRIPCQKSVVIFGIDAQAIRIVSEDSLDLRWSFEGHNTKYIMEKNLN